MTNRQSAQATFIWNDFSRFVEVAPVGLGWLVMWGRYRNMGRQRDLRGQRTYTGLEGARRRVADSVLELTHNPALVAEALALFDRATFPHFIPTAPPEPI